MKTIQDLNEIANDIAVSRLELSSLEKQREELLANIPELIALEALIASKKMQKTEMTDKLLESMRAESLKSWKTEQAVFSRAVRKTAKLDPIVKKQIEDKLKKGEEVSDWTLEETEYISIRINKQ